MNRNDNMIEQSLSVIESLGGHREDLSFSDKIGYSHTQSGFTLLSCLEKPTIKEIDLNRPMDKENKVESRIKATPSNSSSYNLKNLKSAFEQYSTKNELDLKQLKDELIYFQRQGQEWEKERNDYQDQIKTLEQQVSSLINDNQKILAQLFCKVDSEKKSQREKSLKEIESEINQKWIDEVNYLEKQLQDKEYDLNACKHQLMMSLSQVSELQQTVQSQGDKLDNQQQTINKLRKKLDAFFDDGLLRELNKEKELNQRLIEKIKEKDIDNEAKIQKITSASFDIKQENLYLLDQVKHLEIQIQQSILEKEDILRELEQLKQIKVYLESKMKFYQEDQANHGLQFTELKNCYEQKLKECQDQIKSFNRRQNHKDRPYQQNNYIDLHKTDTQFRYHLDNVDIRRVDDEPRWVTDTSNYQSQRMLIPSQRSARKSLEAIRRSAEKNRRSSNYNMLGFE